LISPAVRASIVPPLAGRPGFAAGPAGASAGWFAVDIVKPVFIVGMPRSGTTILYEKLARHPDFACLTMNTRKYPRSVLLTRIYGAFRRDPRPTEAPRVWSRAAGEEDDTLTAADATPSIRKYYRDVVLTQMRIARRPRFLAKYPRNGLRMKFLDAVFPDALFIHLIRDCRAVVRSILEKRERHGGRDSYWGIRPPGWRELDAKDPVEAIALQYVISVSLIREAGAAFRPARYTELKYEDFCSDPRRVLSEVASFCGLEWPPALLERLGAGIRRGNDKWQGSFTAGEMAKLNRVAGPLLSSLGYDS